MTQDRIIEILLMPSDEEVAAIMAALSLKGERDPPVAISKWAREGRLEALKTWQGRTSWRG